MKKIITYLFASVLMARVAQKAQAQPGVVVSMVSQYGNTVDTVTDGGTKYMKNSVAISGYQKLVTVSVHLDEISGTTAGTISIEASLDGTNWYPYYSSRDTSFTFSPSDAATNDFRFSLFDFRERYVRVKYVGSGTMSDKIYTKLLY